jgi:hypothetical protein
MSIQLAMPQNWHIDAAFFHASRDFEARQHDASKHDPLPDPEPIAPSLSEPDPGVFHHEPGQLEEPQENDLA